MLTRKQVGRIIAGITQGRHDGDTIQTIPRDTKDKESGLSFKKFKDPSAKIEILPTVEYAKGGKRVKPYRDVVLITGPSGQGKSTFVANYATKFNKIFPKAPVF